MRSGECFGLNGSMPIAQRFVWLREDCDIGRADKVIAMTIDIFQLIKTGMLVDAK